MRLDRGRIDQQLRRWTVGRRQGMKEARPHAFGCPSLETVVERLPGAVDRRCIFPTATGYQHMHNAADNPAIIHPRLAPRITRQMRLDPSELVFRQPEISVFQQRTPSGDLESCRPTDVDPFYGSQP